MISHSIQKRTYIGDLSKYIDEEVAVEGWVHVRRDQGKMIFFELRDISGITQSIVLPKSSALEKAKNIREEYVVRVDGVVRERPEQNKKAGVPNGDIELEIAAIDVINTSTVPPFPIHENTRAVDESIRLEHRYLDMRNARLKKNIVNRFRVQNFIRNSLAEQSFIEVETPLLSAPTPEGARSFVVPSRVYKGRFYSLPQSPQQYKQLLMVGGLEKYFQFARCMRDEDARGDRQPEFTQFDMEMSFVSREDVMALNEELLIALVKEHYPNKKIQQTPFPRMIYTDALSQYGSDRPDIREDKNDPDLLAFLWIVDFPMFEKTGDENYDDTGEWTFTHNPFSRPQERYMDDFMRGENIGEILSTQYDITLNGFEIGGGSIRNHQSSAQRKTFEIMGYDARRIDANFGHMLKALDFGAPTHGGIAWGFDRLMMLLENEPNIREVIPFAKTGDGKDLLMHAPSDISSKAKKELGLI